MQVRKRQRRILVPKLTGFFCTSIMLSDRLAASNGLEIHFQNYGIAISN